MNTEDLDALHRNPDNWHLVFFYFAPGDPRIVVRKRLGIMGWTLNFARPMAIPFLVALIGSATYSSIPLSPMQHDKTLVFYNRIDNLTDLEK